MTEQLTDVTLKHPAWLLNGCPTWCHWDGRNGEHFHHYDRDEYDNRVHISESTSITLTGTDAPSLTYDGKREVFNTPVTVQTYLIQHYREGEARIHLGEDDLPGMHLTLSEAERLAAQLLVEVATARGEV